MTARAHIIPVFVPNLGCPHACVFCNQRRISGSLTPATAEDVRRAVLQAAASTPEGAKRQLAFYGGSFTAVPADRQERLLAAAQPFLADGTLSALRVSTRPDAVDDAALVRLRRFGVETVELGAQSMDDGVLALSGRGHTAGDVTEAAKRVKAAGFKLILQMMTGLPGSDDARDLETARALAALAPDGVRIYPTVIVRDTALCELWRAGRYREHTVEDAVRVCAQLLPIFEAAGIPVIRLGLNPTEELTAGGAVGGAYHPALGELVRARILLRQAEALLAGTEPGADIVLGIDPTRLSQLVGQHGCNRRALEERFAPRSLHIRPVPGAAGVVLLSVAKSAAP